MSQHSISQFSLPAIILININVMLGLGIFINSVQLAQFAGALGFVVYLIIGAIMLPLIISIARLLKIHPGGSFYLFGARELSPYWGFLSTWSYATGKLASATIMIHFFSSIMASMFPVVASFGVLPLDVVLICLFTLLNLQNMSTGRSIQYMFFILKSLPVLFVILTGLFYLNGGNFASDHLLFSGIAPALPLAIYTFLGFEVSCALSQHIKNSERNAPRAIYYSYAIVVAIASIFQLMIYAVLGSSLALAGDYTQALPLFVTRIIHTTSALPVIKTLLLMAIATSSIGGAYGILFSNTWNLHALAKHGHLFLPRLMGIFNKNAIPTGCVLIQALICLLYLIITQGYNVPLQYIASFGGVVAYTISIVALLCAEKRLKSKFSYHVIGFLGILNCLILLGFCINGFIVKEVTQYLAFFGINLLAGSAMFWYRLKREPHFEPQ